MKKSELMAEQARLLTLANELTRKHWGVDYTGTIRLVNYSWSLYNGLFRWNKDTGLQEIKMSVIRNAERTPEEVEGTVLHELVHWRLYTLGLPASDRDYEFIAECLRVGAPSQTLNQRRMRTSDSHRYVLLRNGQDANLTKPCDSAQLPYN